ncbi:MAG TPA: NADH-quinone oxidoreductase subunit N [Anaerolineales bacterium]|nr:NADH-quinone oxidoreductase subunit N [Anaerolineales bacterium]
MTRSDLYTILPLLILIGWACVLLLVDLFIPKGRKGWTALLACVGLAASLGVALAQSGRELTGFCNPTVIGQCMIVLDGFSSFLSALFLASGLFGIAIAYGYLKRLDIERGEYYSLILFSISGMMLMAQAADLIVVFLALELLSIPLYVLAAWARPRTESEEAGIKYFLLGAFATGFVVYGIALVYGATGATSLSGIVSAITAGSFTRYLLLIGAALILVGFSFKVAAVPFHMWTPDVYQGAPTSVTGFMAVGAKAAGFAALLRIFVTALPSLDVDLVPVLWGLAAITMFGGNILAISQTNIKRMLAYSSIAHAGYILMALVAYGNPTVAGNAVASALFYLVTYAVTSFGAWSVVIALEKPDGKGLEINDFAGLGKRKPALAAAMTIFMLSLTGMPPTLGLVGKFYLFRTAIQGGFIGLAVIGVLTSLISAYYYLRVIVVMYMKEGEPETTSEPWLDLTTAVTALGTVALSFLPAALFAMASGAMLKLF